MKQSEATDSLSARLLEASGRTAAPRSAVHLANTIGLSSAGSVRRVTTVLDTLARNGKMKREVRPVYDGPGGGARRRAYYSLT